MPDVASWHGVVELERPETWRAPVAEALDRGLPVLKGYERERRRIDELLKTDETLRIARPANPHRTARGALAAQVSGLLASADLVGYHCARLHDDEIAAIRREGMAPLSGNLLESRIRRRVAAGDVPEPLGRRLLAEHRADDEARQGMIWFINSRSLLADEHGVSRLFASWGGEALYHMHERDAETGPLLRNIGQPCIVIASLPAARYATYGRVGEPFCALFMRQRGLATEWPRDMEGHLDQPLPPERVLDVFTFDTPRFDELTRASTWDKKLA